MASIKSIAVYSDVPWRAGQRKRRYEITLTDNNAVDHTEITNPVKQQPADDGTLIADKLLQSRKDKELREGEKAAEWADTQADFDRRALGRAMLLTDTDDFYFYLPLFKAMELRGGANANQRAAYLGIDRAIYDQIAARFNDVEGIAFFLDNYKSQIWDEIPPGFE